MAFVSYERADALHAKEKEIRAVKVTDADSCCEYFKGFFEFIFNHKMFGCVYDIYADSIKVRRENGMVLEGIPEVELEIMRLNTAFPDLKVDIQDIFAVPSGADSYKIWMRYYFTGTNNGYSIYGEPTGLAMTGDKAINLSTYYVENVDGEWLILDELTGRPEDYIRYVCTGDDSFNDHLFQH